MPAHCAEPCVARGLLAPVVPTQLHHDVTFHLVTRSRKAHDGIVAALLDGLRVAYADGPEGRSTSLGRRPRTRYLVARTGGLAMARQRKVCIALVIAAALLAATPAWARSLPPGELVWLTGCVMDGEHFGPVQVDVTVSLPGQAAGFVVRSDHAGRFVVAVPHHTRVGLSVAPLPADGPWPGRSAPTLQVTTGSADLAVAGCLVLW